MFIDISNNSNINNINNSNINNINYKRGRFVCIIGIFCMFGFLIGLLLYSFILHFINDPISI